MYSGNDYRYRTDRSPQYLIETFINDPAFSQINETSNGNSRTRTAAPPAERLDSSSQPRYLPQPYEITTNGDTPQGRAFFATGLPSTELIQGGRNPSYSSRQSTGNSSTYVNTSSSSGGSSSYMTQTNGYYTNGAQRRRQSSQQQPIASPSSVLNGYGYTVVRTDSPQTYADGPFAARNNTVTANEEFRPQATEQPSQSDRRTTHRRQPRSRGPPPLDPGND